MVHAQNHNLDHQIKIVNQNSKCHGFAPVFERTKFVYYIYTYYTWFCALLSWLKLFIRLKKLHNACLYLYLPHEHLMHSCYTIWELCCYLLYVPIGHGQLEGIKRNTIRRGKNVGRKRINSSIYLYIHWILQAAAIYLLKAESSAFG